MKSTAFAWGLAVAAGLLAGGVAMAADPPPPMSCTTDGCHNWTIEVTAGPCAVDCAADNSTASFCDPAGACTGIEYTITQNGTLRMDHVVTMVRDSTAHVPPAQRVYAPCEGDPTTRAGKYACHEQAVRLFDYSSTGNRVRVVVDGAKQPIATSVVVKSQKTIESCRIAGLGRVDATPVDCVPSCGGFDPSQTLTRTEELTFKDCTVRFTYDLRTGSVVSAGLTPDSIEHGCDFDSQPVQNLELRLNGTSLGSGAFGDGIISTGSESCSTRVISGRVYTWGSPCP